jgi:hypothetical protein
VRKTKHHNKGKCNQQEFLSVEIPRSLTFLINKLGRTMRELVMRLVSKKEPRTAVRPSEAKIRAALPVQIREQDEETNNVSVALVATEVKQNLDVFSRFADHLSEGGKTQVITNRTSRFIGFEVPIEELPGIMETASWAISKPAEGTTAVLGWLFLSCYSQRSNSWRVRNDHSMFGNIAGSSTHVLRTKDQRSGCTGERKFELTFSADEIAEIDADGLKTFAVSLKYGLKPKWPVSPWTQSSWHYQWTTRGQEQYDAARRGK